MKITYSEAADFLRENNNYYILTHANPDGDTVGSGFGLCYVLRKMGKNANVFCSDPLPKRYGFMYEGYIPQKFSPDKIIAVDVADPKLLGSALQQYAEYVDLCIDHHVSNVNYAKMTLVEPDAAAACQVIYKLIESQKLAEPDKLIATCLYTGISTDSGCFKFSCTTPETHMAAARLLEYGFDAAWINRRMFDCKSRSRIKVEQHIMNTMEFYLDDKCAIAVVTLEDMERTGLPAEEFEGLSPITTMLESVEVGVLIREKEKGRFKVSLRSTGDTDVSAICGKFGGGGHAKAAGCTITENIEDVKLSLLSAIAPALGIDLWLA